MYLTSSLEGGIFNDTTTFYESFSFCNHPLMEIPKGILYSEVNNVQITDEKVQIGMFLLLNSNHQNVPFYLQSPSYHKCINHIKSNASQVTWTSSGLITDNKDEMVLWYTYLVIFTVNLFTRCNKRLIFAYWWGWGCDRYVY